MSFPRCHLAARYTELIRDEIDPVDEARWLDRNLPEDGDRAWHRGQHVHELGDGWSQVIHGSGSMPAEIRAAVRPRLVVAAIKATYSARNTVIGSTRVARQMGSSAAKPATVASMDDELASDTQSNGSTP